VILVAMTDEELLLQAKILSDKTDSTTNPNMQFKANKTLNKGLNPEYYSGNNTKIVNILNALFESDQQVTSAANKVAQKVNEVLGDTETTLGAVDFEKLQGLMEQPTIIKSLIDLYEGKQIDKILNLDLADKGKVLSIDQNKDGDLVLKAIDMIAQGATDVSVETIEYTNSKVSSIDNVKEALDYVIEKIANGDFGDNEWGGGTIIGEITWDMIDDRPEFIADGLELTNDQLILKDGESVLSTVPLIDNTDIDDIINQLD
jgi:hypothetical protein